MPVQNSKQRNRLRGEKVTNEHKVLLVVGILAIAVLASVGLSSNGGDIFSNVNLYSATGGNDPTYGTGITINTDSVHGEDRGVEGRGESVGGPYWIKSGKAQVTTGKTYLEIGSYKGWFDIPLKVSGIRNYWWVVDLKIAGSNTWLNIIGKNSINTGFIDSINGNGIQQGWKTTLKSQQHHKTNSLSFDLNAPSKGGAIKVSLYCRWYDDGEEKTFVALTDYAYIVAEPLAAPPKDKDPDSIQEGTGRVLTVKTNLIGCSVHLYSGHGSQGTKVTGSSGVTWTSLPSGQYVVTISKKGYQAITYQPIKIPGIRTLTFSLTKEGEEDKPGAPPSEPPSHDVKIKTTPSDCNVRLTGEGMSDEQVAFVSYAEWLSLPPGSYTVTVSKSGYTTKTKTFEVPIRSPSHTIKISLGQTYTLTVITNPGATVQVSTTGQRLIETANDGGNAYFEVINGKYMISFSKAGYYSNFKHATVDGDTTFTYYLRRSGPPSDQLYVSVEGRPEGATVVVEGDGYYETKTVGKHGGSLYFQGVPEGFYTITCTPPSDRCIVEPEWTCVEMPSVRYAKFLVRCKGEGGIKSYKLTVITTPEECTVTPNWYSSKISGLDGASWFLRDGTYSILVEKEMFDSQEVTVKIEGEDETIHVNLFDTPPKPPAPNATITGPSEADINEPVVVVAGGDKEDLLYRFSWGDGEVTRWLREDTAMHKYLHPGTYIVSVIVNDGTADSEPAQLEITIESEEMFKPIITVSDVIVNKIGTATITLKTGLDKEDYYIKTYVRDSKGNYLVEQWTVLKDIFRNNEHVAKVQFRCNEPGDIFIGAIGTASTFGYLDTEEAMETILCMTESQAAGEDPKPGEEPVGEFTGSPEDYLVRKTPGFEIMGLIAALGISLIILKKKRR